MFFANLDRQCVRMSFNVRFVLKNPSSISLFSAPTDPSLVARLPAGLSEALLRFTRFREVDGASSREGGAASSDGLAPPLACKTFSTIFSWTASLLYKL